MISLFLNYYLIFFLFSFSLFFLEIIVYYLKGKKYDFRELISSLVIAWIKVFDIAFILFLLPHLRMLWVKHRLFDLSSHSWVQLFLVFIIVDLWFYFSHRTLHSVRWFWASHSVHHSSKSLTFATSQRLSLTEWISGKWIFFIPLILIGFDPLTLFEMFFLNIMLQIFSHTEIVNKMGFLDYFFNTPSNHRIHHMNHSNLANKNFGGVFIVFDKIFGTYQADDGTFSHEYGIKNGIDSSRPLKVVFGEWFNLWRKRPKTGLRSFLTYVLSSPKRKI